MIPERQDDGTTVCQNPAAVCGSFAPPSFGVDCLPAELCGVTPNPVCPAEDPGEADTAGPDTAAGTGSETTAETTADTTAASIPETTAPVLPGAQPPSAEAMVSSAGSAITP
jgi:hypothetical protein